MATTTPYMGLTKWDDLNDYFSHLQLAANFQTIDDHDHSSGRGKQIPAGGLAPLSVASSNLQDGVFSASKIADDAITESKIDDGAVTNAKIVAAAGIPDSKLASPASGVYRHIFDRSVIFNDTHTAATYLLAEAPYAAATNGSAAAVVYLDPADYPSGTLTKKYRVRASLLTNATAPGTITYTVGLYPISAVAGGTDEITCTAGTVTTDSTVAFVDPTLSTRHQGASTAFTPPVAGYYALGVVLSASVATDARTALWATLQTNAV